MRQGRCQDRQRTDYPREPFVRTTQKEQVMRIAYSAFATMLLVSALPSVSFAQILVPYTKIAASRVARLDHVVPVATVTPPGDAITLADPKPGVDLVLGAAKLDIRDPDHPMIVFTVSNQTERPLPPSSVDVHVATVYASRDGAPMVSLCGYSGSLQSMLLNTPGSSGLGNATLAPGATVTMALHVGPTNCAAGRPNVPLGFLVHLTTDGPPPLPDRMARLRRALEAQRSQAQQ
jgi:hypothetical protein